MEGIVNQLKASWQVMGEKARRAFKRYAVFTLVMTVIIVPLSISLPTLDTFGLEGLPIDPAMALSLAFLLLIFLFAVLILMVVFVVGAYKAIKRDYFARAFPGETFIEQQNHWRKRDALLLYVGLVSLVGIVPNVVTIVLELMNLPNPDVTTIISRVIWIGVACWAVPRCCDRYLSPPRQLGDGIATSVMSNPTEGHEQ